jgi:tetratricopeptide (TPR) repeat protein
MLHRRECFRFRLVLPLIVFILVVPAKADKNNKFYLNIDRYTGMSGAYFRSAIAEWDKGNIGGARQLLDAAIKADKQLWPAYLMRAEAWMQFGKYDLALQDCNAAARLKPQFTRTFIVRAQVLEALGRCPEGLADLNQVIAVHSTPESVAFALDRRAWLRIVCRNTAVHDPKKALEDATKACHLQRLAVYVDTLGLAYAANGDFDSAIRYAKEAIATGRLEPDELKRVQMRLAGYQRRQLP